MPTEEPDKPEPLAGNDYRGKLQTEVERKYREYYWGCMGWSFRYHLCLFGSIVASTLAASWLKLDLFKGEHQNDYSAALAILAAILTAITVAGRFSEKWRANRVSRSLTEQLKLDLLDPAADVTQIREKLKETIKKHDETILGPEL
jgi:hypothetical protein